MSQQNLLPSPNSADWGRVPDVSRGEVGLPVRGLAELAIREGNKKRPVYEMHKWWARRLACNFRMILIATLAPADWSEKQLWNSFYSQHPSTSLHLLDPFMGGGTTVVEAVKLGLKPVGFDIDPVARFITKCEIQPSKSKDAEAMFNEIGRRVKPAIDSYYRTQDSRGNPASTISGFWVAVTRCKKCGIRVPLHPHYRLYDFPAEPTSVVFCASCGKVQSVRATSGVLRCVDCGDTTRMNEGTVRRGQVQCGSCGQVSKLREHFEESVRPSYELFALETVDAEKHREFRAAMDVDHETYRRAERALQRGEASLLVPEDKLPREHRADPRPIVFGMTRYREIFNARQLLCLSLIATEIARSSSSDVKDLLTLALSDSLASNNMLCAYAFGYRKLTPLFGLHAYRFVHRPVEGHVWGTTFGRGSFRNCFKKVLRGKAFSRNPTELVSRTTRSGIASIATGEIAEVRPSQDFKTFQRASRGALLKTGSSDDLSILPDSSIDLVVTDPPYFDNLAYSELSHFYSVWISRMKNNEQHELTEAAMRNALWSPGPSRVEAEREFEVRMTKVMHEIGRVTKPNAPLVLTYHHSRPEAWIALIRSLQAGGFRVTAMHPVRSEGRSGFHSHVGSIKWDAVIFSRRVGRPYNTNLIDPLPAEISFRRLKEEVRKSGVPAGKIDYRTFAMAVRAIAVCQQKGSSRESIAALVSDIREFADRVA